MLDQGRLSLRDAFNNSNRGDNWVCGVDKLGHAGPHCADLCSRLFPRELLKFLGGRFGAGAPSDLSGFSAEFLGADDIFSSVSIIFQNSFSSTSPFG